MGVCEAPADIEAGWTVEEFLEQLPHHRPVWFRFEMRRFHGDRAELGQRLVAHLEALSIASADGMALTHTALVLVALGQRQGADRLREALRSGPDPVRDYAVGELCAIWANLGDHAQTAAGAPAWEAREVVDALRGHAVGGRSLEFFLAYAFEESLPLTRARLRDGSPGVRLLIAEAYLHRGRDEGALEAARDLLARAWPADEELRLLWQHDAGRLARAARRYLELASPDARRDGSKTLGGLVRTAMAQPEALERTRGDWFFELVSAADSEDLAGEVVDHPQVAPLARAQAAWLNLRHGEGARPPLERLSAALEDDRLKPEVRTRLARHWTEQLTAADARRQLLRVLLQALAEPRLSRELAPLIAELAEPDTQALARVALEHARAVANSDDRWAIAEALLRLGDESADNLAALQPWRATAVRWAAASLSIEELARALQACGAANPPVDTTLENLRHADPHTQVLGLLDARLAFANLHEEDGDLFGRLAASASPPVPLDSLVETGGLETDGLIEYVGAVLQAFNAFMADIGHPQRAFQLAPEPGTNGDWAFFAVAHESEFPRTADELGIPWLRKRLRIGDTFAI